MQMYVLMIGVFAAVQNENMEMISLLLRESDCDVDHREHHGWAALHEASKQGNKPIVHMLLKARAQPNILTNLGETPIYIGSLLLLALLTP